MQKLATLQSQNDKFVTFVTTRTFVILSSITLAFFLCAVCLYFNKESENQPIPLQLNSYGSSKSILRTIPRTTQKQYTQGLFFINETTLIESSGMWGESSLHSMNINNINEFQIFNMLDGNIFGEGCDAIGNKIYQLTWKNRIILVYDAYTLMKQEELRLDSQIREGWGLTHRQVDGTIEIIISDGSSFIYIANENFQVQRKIQIKHKNGTNVQYMNELEFANNLLYANIYLTTYIVAIDLSNGRVVKEYDFHGLKILANRTEYSECLNGIAYYKKNDTFWITGKYWPFFWEVKLE